MSRGWEVLSWGDGWSSHLTQLQQDKRKQLLITMNPALKIQVGKYLSKYLFNLSFDNEFYCSILLSRNCMCELILIKIPWSALLTVSWLFESYLFWVAEKISHLIQVCGVFNDSMTCHNLAMGALKFLFWVKTFNWISIMIQNHNSSNIIRE